jgi:hypothetical protein
MKLCGLNVHVLPCMPQPQYPPVALAYVDAVHACIGPTDVVEIYPSYGCDVPLLGRILLTSFDKEEVLNDDYAPPHPYITNKEVLDGPSFFKVQIFITKENSPPAYTDIWPPSSDSMPTTIPAAAPTNCVVWIHSTQIQTV